MWNHPSVTCGDSSPLGELSATQTEGWFLATNLTAVGWFLATNLKDIRSGAMGWFPTQNLKINRTTAMYTQKNLFPNNPP